MKIVRWMVAGALSTGMGARGQVAAPAASVPAASAQVAKPRDEVVDAGENLVGKALFLRGFYVADDLAYDAVGRVKGTPKVGDWTVAGMNVQRVERRGPGEIELDGVRVAVRWNPDQQQFERHPLADEKVKVLVDAVDETGFRRAVGGIFAVGIDPALQRAMPDYWLHYFQPATPWPQDELTGQTPVALYGQKDQPSDVTAPKPQRSVEPKYTKFALHDRVKGTLQVRLVVDAEGAARRVAVARPLGYGLDEAAVEAVRQWRFTPGMKQGKAVPVAVVVAQGFEVVAAPK